MHNIPGIKHFEGICKLNTFYFYRPKLNLKNLFDKISSMNIFQTFELFLSQPLSIIRNRIIQICHVEANGVDIPNKVQFNLSNESAQINVYNSPKIYNLLSAVLYKKKKLSKENDYKESQIHNERGKTLTVS